MRVFIILVVIRVYELYLWGKEDKVWGLGGWEDKKGDFWVKLGFLMGSFETDELGKKL